MQDHVFPVLSWSHERTQGIYPGSWPSCVVIALRPVVFIDALGTNRGVECSNSSHMKEV
jgi:hypothetical protein